jgi:fimbrial chaperone protein
MIERIAAGLSALLGLVAASACGAASLQVAPVTIDLTAPAQAATVHLQNGGQRPVNVQVRVFKWTQSGGQDRYEPTTEVVASPPAATLPAGTTYTIRVARVAPPVAQGEQSYRLLIDELPEVNVRRPAGSVNLTIRYSLPVFFADRAAGAALKWEVVRQGGRLIARATNTGNRHAKIADLTIAGPGGKVGFGGGLNGYVLPGSTKEWSTAARAIRPGNRVTITAKGNDYAVDQTAVVSGR